MTDMNRLWVTVSCLAEGNLFAVYPRILAAMLENSKGFATGPPDFDFILPSNYEWQTKIYYQLVDKQRLLKGTSQVTAFLDRPKSAGPWDTTVPQPPYKKFKKCSPVSSSFSSRASVASSVAPVTWTVNDIVKAALLLSKQSTEIEFHDEQEMRRVYTLIFDMFRYKHILNQALLDISFYGLFPDLEEHHQLVWLLLFDLYHRRFAERDFADGSAETADKLFPECGLAIPEAALWATRVRLAAAMSRLRIANSALRLSDMLPYHLRDEKLVKAVQVAPVTCWVNKNKFADLKLPHDILSLVKEEFSLQALPNDSNSNFCAFHVRWDTLCPMSLVFHYSQRTAIAQSTFVRNNALVMLNRSFCLGPAIFSKILLQHNLTGSVVQSHLHSPRATAYLATLLSQNEQINSLLVFGAGQRKTEYEEYFKKMNIKNILIHAQKLVELNPESSLLEHVCAVFATPSNSYSAVSDPIDLVCSRGGDITMLEILTDTTESEKSKKRVASILEDQRFTLRFSMSRPQIQFVLYETHSALNAENNDMVKKVVQEVNRAAQYKHAELQGKISAQTSYNKTETNTSNELIESEINNNETEIKSVLTTSIEEKEMNISMQEEEIIRNIEVPPTDSFEHHRLPDLCFNEDQCLRLADEGCYLALIQRKEITRLDAKYMIKMAESRGLFGSNVDGKSKTKQKTVKPRKQEVRSVFKTPVKRKRSFEVERIAAPTHASMMRTYSAKGEHDPVVACCPRHGMIKDERPKSSPARLWWNETVKYLTKLRVSLLKQRIISKDLDRQKINQDLNNIDEILHCVQMESRIPPLPRLRLSRASTPRTERQLYPISIKTVPEDNEDSDSDIFY